MIPVKTSQDIEFMRAGGEKLGGICEELLSMSAVGVNLLDLEKYAKRRVQEEGGQPSFTTVEEYPFVTCLCINDEVVHGIPRDYRLKNGDILTVDIGMIYKGLHTDMAWTVCVGDCTADGKKTRFLAAGKDALKNAIKAGVAGNRVGNISKAIQDVIEGAGFSVVKDLTGHGVGRILHEEPMIPEYVHGEIGRAHV